MWLQQYKQTMTGNANRNMSLFRHLPKQNSQNVEISVNSDVKINERQQSRANDVKGENRKQGWTNFRIFCLGIMLFLLST